MMPSTRFLAFVVALSGATIAGPAFAQGEASCSGGSPLFAPQFTAAFKTDPRAFIAGLASGDRDVAEVVRRLVTQSPGVVSATGPDGSSALAAAAKALPAQSGAIARGLAAAAKDCIDARQPDLATAIQATVVTQFDTAFQAEFARATSDPRTAATAGASQGGSNGGSGVTLTNLVTNRGTSPATGSSTFRNSDFTVNPGDGTQPTLATRGTSTNSGDGTQPLLATGGTSTLVTRTINISSSPTSVNGF